MNINEKSLDPYFMCVISYRLHICIKLCVLVENKCKSGNLENFDAVKSIHVVFSLKGNRY